MRKLIRFAAGAGAYWLLSEILKQWSRPSGGALERSVRTSDGWRLALSEYPPRGAGSVAAVGALFPARNSHDMSFATSLA